VIDAATPRRTLIDELRRRLARLEQRPPAPAPRLPPGEIYARALPRPLRQLDDAEATPWGARFTARVPVDLRGLRDDVAARLAGVEGAAGLLAGLRIVDLETTGLAGGTGTLAFLVGVGWPDGSGFVVEQLLLGSPAHEGAFLEALAARLAGGTLLVSFNGRSFDVPLLRTRCVLNRRAAPLALPHLDLIAPARRLWRARAGDCRLVTLEEHVLRRRRLEDVPGSFAPTAFGEFLRSGDARLLAHVVRHNRDDVAGTAALLASALRILAEPLAWASDAGELLGAAEHHLRHHGAAAALPLAARALELARTRELRRRALLLGARLARRLGDLSGVERLWQAYQRDFPRENRGYVELAKILEHRRRDPGGALRVALAAPHGAAEDLERRIARLRRRVDRASR
jgi:hypothetical protein